jgi:hypothetical protein
MPTIPELPQANMTGGQDELPVSQSGITRSVTIAELLAGTQPAIILPSSTLLGRVSLGPGGPEPVQLGAGLAIEGPEIAANGTDHAGFPLAPSLNLANQAVINANGVPMLLALSALHGVYNAGANISINGSGTISASTDPVVTADLSTLTTDLATTDAEVAALAAKIPPGGFVGLNAQGQITDPMAGSVSLGTVQVTPSSPSRTLVAKALDTVNVVDFGAMIGMSDSVAAFNAAFNALPATGGEIFVPSGNYSLLSSVTWSGKPFTLRGAGKGVTRIHLRHSGIGFDISQTDPFAKCVLRDFSAYAENLSGPTAAVARLVYPDEPSFGYVSAFITDLECFGYPNPSNGMPPYPQTFTRGIILNNCWSVQLNNISWFGPGATPGALDSAVIELNRAFDTRITGVQAYFGATVVLQTGYCEGIYFTNPLAVGTDFLFKQTDITQWTGYVPGKLVLLGFWLMNGEVNTNLGFVQASNVAGGYVVGTDFSRNGGPNSSRTLFDFTSVSNFYVLGCGFNGGPSNGNSQDVAFGFTSTFNSSSNMIGGCQFSNMATIVQINQSNGTVGLTTFGINPGNVPLSTAFIDNSNASVGNYLVFQSPATATAPAGIANTKDHVFAAADGTPVFRITSVHGAANYVRAQAAVPSNPPTIVFDGTDGNINGVIQTKGGSLFINASGGTSGSGNLVTLTNMPGSVNWIVMQNATQGNLSMITTNAGGIAVQPKGQLYLSSGSGIFLPGLPTSRPQAGSAQIWNNGGVVSIA